MKSLQFENLFCRSVSFFICTLCQVLGLEQGMKQAKLYLWYPLFQVEWDRFHQHNHQTWNYLLTGYQLYSET